MFSHLQEKIGRWGHNHWYVMYYEYLVRAATVRYLEANEGARAARQRAGQDERDGFIGLGKLADLLTDYETQRDRYPDLDAFISRVVDFFEGMAEGMGRVVVLGTHAH